MAVKGSKSAVQGESMITMPMPGRSASTAERKCGIATYDDADALETRDERGKFVGSVIKDQRSAALGETSRVVMRVVRGAGLVNGVPAC